MVLTLDRLKTIPKIVARKMRSNLVNPSDVVNADTASCTKSARGAVRMAQTPAAAAYASVVVQFEAR